MEQDFHAPAPPLSRYARPLTRNRPAAAPMGQPGIERDVQPHVWRDADETKSQAESSAIVPRSRSELCARVVNVAIAGVALVALAPILVLIGILVKATSPGPIVYRQIRVGLNRRSNGGSASALYDRRTANLGGRIFTMYKFRSMRVDAERQTGAVWARAGDARVTAIGRVMRATRLDELPQLVNVLLGDMSIVGPRPERPGIFRRLSQSIDHYELRQRARPGITGLAQVSQGYDTCLADVATKVRYDLEYLQRQSVAEDLRIMLKTVPTMLLRRTGL